MEVTVVRTIDNNSVDIEYIINGQTKDKHTKYVMIVEWFKF